MWALQRGTTVMANSVCYWFSRALLRAGVWRETCWPWGRRNRGGPSLCCFSASNFSFQDCSTPQLNVFTHLHKACLCVSACVFNFVTRLYLRGLGDIWNRVIFWLSRRLKICVRVSVCERDQIRRVSLHGCKSKTPWDFLRGTNNSYVSQRHTLKTDFALAFTPFLTLDWPSPTVWTAMVKPKMWCDKVTLHFVCRLVFISAPSFWVARTCWNITGPKSCSSCILNVEEEKIKSFRGILENTVCLAVNLLPRVFSLAGILSHRVWLRCSAVPSCAVCFSVSHVETFNECFHW